MMLCPLIIWLAVLKTLQDDVMSCDHVAGSPPVHNTPDVNLTLPYTLCDFRYCYLNLD